MPTALRQRALGLIRRVLGAPWRFEMFQAVRLIERALVGMGGASSSSPDWRVRFRNSTSMGFAPSDIEGMRVLSHDAGPEVPLDALDAWMPHDMTVEITQPVVGLLGVGGALPYTYTEGVNGTASHRRQPETRVFLDLLSDRSARFLYRAWKYRRPALHSETDGEGGIRTHLGHVAGLGYEPMAGGALPGRFVTRDIASHAGALRMSMISGPYLERLLTAYLGYPVRVRDLVPTWHDIPPAARSRLGVHRTTLGVDAVLGRRFRQGDLRIEIELGPLPMAAWRRLLPGGADVPSLAHWLLAYLGDSVEVLLIPVLRAADVHGAVLGQRGELGRGAFLHATAPATDRRDVRYLLTY